MAHTRHLPIWKAAFDLAVYLFHRIHNLEAHYEHPYSIH